jgi:hypothetical protein
MGMRRKERWSTVADIIAGGGQLHVVTEGHGVCVSSLESDGQLVCMIETGGGDFQGIMDELEALAQRFVEDGIVTDRVNGTEHDSR